MDDAVADFVGEDILGRFVGLDVPRPVDLQGVVGIACHPAGLGFTFAPGDPEDKVEVIIHFPVFFGVFQRRRGGGGDHSQVFVGQIAKAGCERLECWIKTQEFFDGKPFVVIFKLNPHVAGVGRIGEGFQTRTGCPINIDYLHILNSIAL